jgi:aarF domain-containing kinase
MFRFQSSSRKIFYRGAGAATLTATAAVGVACVYDEGTQRSLQFWSNIFPLYLSYRGVQLLNRDLGILSDDRANIIYDSFHEKFTDHVKDIVYKMRGFYLKQAQMMSTQDDFVPPAYMLWVKDTQDNVPSEFKGNEARIYATLKIKEELGLEFDEVFERWDDIPIGVGDTCFLHVYIYMYMYIYEYIIYICRHK